MQPPRSQTLLSSLEGFQRPNVFQNHVLHPFDTAAPETCGLLQDLIDAVDQIAHSLVVYDSGDWSNTKLTSFLRQHTSIEHTTHSSSKNVQHLINVLTSRSGINYGEDLPLSTECSQWCIDQLVAWGSSVGMETFKDDSKEGALTVVLGGKVLVIDVEFVIEQYGHAQTRLTVAIVKTSNALLPGNSNPSTSTLLDAFLADSIQQYCAEIQMEEGSRDPLRASQLRKAILDHLRYLVLLDGLASRSDDGGIRWFTDIDEILPTLMAFARNEAKVVASSLASSKVPLDIFLLRSHSLPLPYLTMPSISFLTYISPSVYLSLMDSIENPLEDEYSFLDVGFSCLKAQIGSLTNFFTLARLSLEKISEAHLYPSSMSIPNVIARPSFPLFSPDLDHSFPQLDVLENKTSDNFLSQHFPPYSWVLDFTEGGKRTGVVMSQSRMRAVELVVNPLGGGNDLNGVAEMLAFGAGSWVDLLLNPGNVVSPERYTGLFRSPNNLHPPLQLRLTAPEEPGFILERIPVHGIREIWGILEVVREQCWLNEILLGCHWTTEGLKSEEEVVPDDLLATDDELQAVLAGTIIPRLIPVNVFLPSATTTEHLFTSADMDFTPAVAPKVTMTCPQHPPMSGLVEITVTHDVSKPKGISVEIHGAMGYDLKYSQLEEICRRGGTLGLPGRLWASNGMTAEKYQ